MRTDALRGGANTTLRAKSLLHSENGRRALSSMPTFEERLAEDLTRRKECRQKALAQKEMEQIVPSFHPELNPKTSKILAARAARDGSGEEASCDVFARQEREKKMHEERRRQANERKLKEEGTLFMPMIKSSSLPADEEAKLAKWEGSKPAHAWAEKKKAMLEGRR